VDLIAGLDALEAAGIAAQVALLDDRTARLLSPPPAEEPASDEPTSDEPASDEDPDDGPRADEPAASDAASDGSPGEDHAATRALQPSAGVVPVAGVQNPADTRVLDQEAAAPAASQPSAALDEAPDAAPARTPAGAEDVGIRLLPGAETTPRSAASDLAQPSIAAERSPTAGDAPTAREPEQPAEASPAASGPSPASAPPETTPAASPAASGPSPASAPSETTPEASPAPGLEPGTRRQPAVSARDVDVLLEAAAADAAARAETDDDPLPPVRQPAARQPAARQTDEHQPADREHAERESPQEPVPWVTSAELPDPVDVTDELPRIESHTSRPRRQEGDQPERDDLRTTAQLAILLDDLEARRDRP
jgi:hypothetical protein